MHIELPHKLADTLRPSVPIYALSPHIDDVIWSTGGFLQSLAQNGHDVTLVTIFSHSIYVHDAILPPAEATLIRKGEDHEAARAAGFREVVFLDYPDGILRDTPQAGVINSAYQTPEYLLDIITESLQKLLPSSAVILVPAAYGGHMDHLTTRRAALQLPQTKVLYTDMPYGTRQHGNDEARAFLNQGWQHLQIPLNPEVIQNHLELFWYYRSQTTTEVAHEVETYLQTHGLQLWIPGL